MKLSLPTNEQWFKVLKAALWVGVSALISAVIASIAQDPNLFGPLTPLVNVVLVFAKQFFSKQ